METMVFVLISELLFIVHNNHSVVEHFECDRNLNVSCAITACLVGRSLVAMLCYKVL